MTSLEKKKMFFSSYTGNSNPDEWICSFPFSWGDAFMQPLCKELIIKAISPFEVLSHLKHLFCRSSIKLAFTFVLSTKWRTLVGYNALISKKKYLNASKRESSYTANESLNNFKKFWTLFQHLAWWVNQVFVSQCEVCHSIILSSHKNSSVFCTHYGLVTKQNAFQDDWIFSIVNYLW